jgi:hypothetical protein
MRFPSCLLALVACSSAATPPPANQASSHPAKPPALAVQLAYRGTFMIGPPFSHVPPFTLLDDGTLIVAREGSTAVETVPLSRGDVARIVRRVRELGFERLKSQTSSCKRLSADRRLCVSDATYTILRVALPSGELREITTYADFSNEPQIHERIVEYLSHYKHPKGTPYRPTRAALHVHIDHAPVTPPCPSIDPALVHLDDGATMKALVLEGAKLTSVLAIAPTNRSSFTACAGNARFQLTLVPGVPGSDLSEELEPYRSRQP